MKKIQSWKNRVIKKLGGGIKLLAKQRNVNVIQGTANFIFEIHENGEYENISVVYALDTSQ